MLVQRRNSKSESKKGKKKHMSKEIRNTQFWLDLAEANPDAVIFDGPGDKDFFDCCIVGYAGRGDELPLLVYNGEKMIERLMFGHEISYEDASEYLSFNTFGAWLGEGTPLILRPKTETTQRRWERSQNNECGSAP